MLKVLKASAGAGKTYALAEEYIRLLVGEESPDAYRHVLAVTFTNKATDEMKRRILKELYILAKTPEKSDYYKDFVPKVVPTAAVLQERAARQLSGILHDYSAFAVSTIDRFFQQTLRAFSREIGQFSSYQVQLDREQLVGESVDYVLDSLGEGDSATIEWLTDGAREDLERTGRFSIEDRLTKMAGSLRDLPEGGEPVSRERLKAIGGSCAEVVKAFGKAVASAAANVISACESKGVQPEQTSRGWLGAIRKYQEPGKEIFPPTEAFLKKAADPSQWFAKKDAQLLDAVETTLEGPLSSFASLFDKPYKEYVTARMIREQLYALGVADSLRQAFIVIQKEKNVISLDDSNTILHGIIDGTDAPFIYEKLGVRYSNFLLDEFQDTADIQWENFLPLVRNSDSTGGTSLVVGDVKQSIYRWRGSDWKLLGERLKQQFPRAEDGKLDGNYRTLREIVYFNNDFFTFAAERLDELMGTNEISNLYALVEQKVKVKDTAPGSVEVVFTDDEMGEIISSLKDLHERGIPWNQMGILVRGNAEGSAIAAAVIGEGIRVVSDDSLFVKSSVTVRRLVSLLSLVESPAQEGKPGVGGFLASEMDIPARDSFNSLTDLAEELLRDIRAYDSVTFDSEAPYIQAFMDYLQDFVQADGNKLSAFLQAWKDASPKIASPAAGDAVRIMTIHKAKGLEFPYVIFPFAEKVTLYKADTRWCAPAVKGTALEGKADGMYNIRLDSAAGNSLFEDSFTAESRLQAVDNINVFYVAMTRAKRGLKVIAAKPPKAVADAVKKGLQPAWKNLSQILYAFVKAENYTRGSFSGPAPEEASDAAILPVDGYPTFPAESGGRLSYSPEAVDYFGEDGATGLLASHRIRGNVLHEILAGIVTAADIPAAVDAAVADGTLPESLRTETVTLLEDRIASVRDRGWFSPGVKALRETPIIGADGSDWRPDRVVIAPDGSVTVIDYKFGAEDPRYLTQVRRYMSLFRAMGHPRVSGFLWYVLDNTIVPVI